MSKFIFIRTASDFASFDTEELKTVTYASSGAVLLTFRTYQDGTETTAKVELAVTAGNEKEACIAISAQARDGAGTLLYSNVSLAGGTRQKDGRVPKQEPSFESPLVTSINSITFQVTEDAAADLPAGGSQFQVLRKVSGTDYDAEWDYADRVTLEVRFDEAVTKGDPLYITGYNNGQNRITVAKADAADSAKMPSIGLAFDDYSTNGNGQATAIGSLDDVDTSSFSEGDVLYVAATGGLTATKPTGTNLIQNVGKVGRSNANNGEIVVMAIGRSNELPNLAQGKIWVGDSSGVPEQVDSINTTNICTLAGRFQFDADDGNRTIICGNSSFGTSYYLWNTEVWDTVDTGTVDTTTQSISNTYGGLSFRVPADGKVRWDFNHKPVNSTGYSQNYRAQIWSVSSFGSTVGSTSWTLRADKEFTSNNTTGGWLAHDVTTTSSLSEGDYVLFTVGLDDATISAIVYLTFQSTVSLVV